ARITQPHLPLERELSFRGEIMPTIFSRRLLIVIGLAAALASVTGATAMAAPEIVVGEYGSLTGGTATFGISTDEGVKLALDEINAKGGIVGRPVRLVVEDDQSKPEGAVTAVQKLLTQDRVVAVIGEVASSRSIAAGPLCQRARIPMLSPSSTNPKVTQIGDYIFRACFIDPFQGAAMANFAMGDLKLKKFAVLYDVKNDYSVGLREFFENTVKKNGGAIIADESYGEGDIDFGAQLTKIQATNPDAIYVPGYYTELGLIARQARELGIKQPLMGGDGWDSDKTAQVGGDSVNGCYFTNHYSPDEKRPEVQAFVAAYRKKYNGKTPDSMAILGYDSMNLIADAITRAGSAKPKALRDALAATKDFHGAGGTITIDKDRNAQKPIVVLKIEGGKFTFVTSIKP
ncbi:MAG: ethanolamine utilization protein EutJ, partial [Phycisphaerales bacterium]|nr:ethanolamine utilization protein EutJ [Phycisphaerales bacterium]